MKGNKTKTAKEKRQGVRTFIYYKVGHINLVN